LASPAGIAARFAQLVFEVVPLLVEGSHFFLLAIDLGGFFVDVVSRILFFHCFCRVRVILHVRLIFFALQNIELFFGHGEFVAQFGKTPPPGSFGIWVFLRFVIGLCISGFFCVGILLICRRRSCADHRDVGFSCGDVVVRNYLLWFWFVFLLFTRFAG